MGPYFRAAFDPDTRANAPDMGSLGANFSDSQVRFSRRPGGQVIGMRSRKDADR
jgi:hypothetical protein